MTSLPSERPSPARRPSRSLKQEYQEFILQRIEEYKNTIPRDELLEIGDEAVRELQAGAEDQYLLTEVLLLEHVDRIIARRLRLPSFPRWRQKHRALREAQREATHWGLDAAHPVAMWAPRLEPGDLAVVVGAAALPEALFLAAHDVHVFLVDQDLRAVEAAEGRAVTEQLGGGTFQALVINFGSWFPDLSPTLVVIEPGSLAQLRTKDRGSLIGDLQARTRSGGAHIVLGSGAKRSVIPLAPETLRALYKSWQIQRGRGFIATKPPRQLDTALNVSD